MNDVRDELKAYLDGELPEGRAAEIAKAIEADPLLQQEAQMLRAIGEGIREIAAAPPAMGFERTMMAVTRHRRPWFTRWPGYVAVGSLVVFASASILFPTFSQSKEAALEDALFASSTGVSGKDGVPQMPSANAGEPEFAAKSKMERGGRTDGVVDLVPFDRDLTFTAGQPDETPTGGAESAGTPAPASTQPNAVPAAERLVVKSGELTLRVDDALASQQQAIRVTKGLGGFVANSTNSTYERGLPSASLTLRVPSKQFETAMEQLAAIEGAAEIVSRSTTGEDVTAQVADVEARLKVLRGEEEQYLEILKATRKIGEVLAVKERLSQVRQEIESYDAQRKVMRDQAALSTIEATFLQRPSVGVPEGPKNWANDAWSRAVNALEAVGTALAKAGIFLFVFSPVWLPVVLIGWWLARRR